MKNWLNLTLLAIATIPAAAQDDAPPGSGTAELLEQAIAETGAPGFGVVVTSAAEVLELEVAGRRRLDGDSPIASDDPFHIGSVTKTMTGTVVGQLVESGDLAWDSKVSDILPRAMRDARPEFAEITLEQLLSHETGIEPQEEDEQLARVPEMSGNIRAQRAEFSSWVLAQPPVASTGEEYRYSNAGFVVAAAMAESASGLSWENLVQTRIFEPLRMTSAGFGWPGKNGEDVPWGHSMVNGVLTPLDPNGSYQLPQWMAPAGDVHASLPDMAAYMQQYIRAWHGDPAILLQDTVRKMQTRRIRSGLGWGVQSAFGWETVAVFSGSADTFLMVIAVIPEADRGFAVVTNSYNEEIEKALIGVLRDRVAFHAPSPE